MAAPCVLIASCANLTPKEIVKDILGVSVLPPGQHVVDEVESYPWHIDNKYYTADILLCTTTTRTIGTQDFANACQGFVVFFNSNQESSFEQVQSWLPFLKEIEPAVQILLCDRCLPDDVVSKQRTLTWCLEKKFELVELSPEDTDSGSEEDDFLETIGIQRVIQALHSHPWSNLQMKEKPTFRSELMQQMMAAEAANNETDGHAEAPSSDQPSEQTPQLQNQNASNQIQSSVNADALESLTETDSSQCTHTSHTQASEKSIKDTKNKQQQRAVQLEMQDSVTSVNAGHDALSTDITENVERGDLQGQPNASSDSIDRLASDVTSSEGASVGGATGGCDSPATGKAKKKMQNEKSKAGLPASLDDDDLALFAAMGNEDPGNESFEQLFDRMRKMKEQAEHLPPEQRKAYAEQVAISFWKAIGGDEEEIRGLSEDDDDLP